MWFSLGYPGSGVKGVAGHPDQVGGGSGIRAGDPRWLTGRPRGTLVRRTKPTHEGPRRESVHAQAGSGAAEGGPGDRRCLRRPRTPLRPRALAGAHPVPSHPDADPRKPDPDLPAALDPDALGADHRPVRRHGDGLSQLAGVRRPRSGWSRSRKVATFDRADGCEAGRTTMARRAWRGGGARAMLATLATVGLLVAVLLGLVWSQQRRLIYYPSPSQVPAAAAVLPGVQEVVFDTEDGIRLGGWFLPARGAGRRPAVLVCNGNAGNRALRAPLAAALSRAGLSVLLFDYRGYGGNPGRPSEDGLAADARAAQAWLAARPEVDPGRIAYLGESLGTAVALRLAVERPPAALVLRSPFTSLADVGRLHYPWLPVKLLLTDRYASAARVAQLTAPVLVIAGERDGIVPATLSRRLYDAATVPKRFVLVPGADHNDAALLDGRQAVGEILGFLERTAVLGASGPGG